MVYDKRFISKKVIQSGNMVEIWEYERPIFRGAPAKSNSGSLHTEEERDKWRKKNKRKAFHSMLRLVTRNFQSRDTYFITLTFEKNIQSVEEGNKEFKLFVQRLRRKLKKDIKYMTTIEFQDKNDRGAVHYHMLANTGYIKNEELRTIWGNGFVRINRVKSCKHAACYAGKYMNKGVYDPRLAGKKSYFRSQNLEKPCEFINQKADDVSEYIKDKKKELYTDTSYLSEYNGMVKYKKYFLEESITNQAVTEKISGADSLD